MRSTTSPGAPTLRPRPLHGVLYHLRHRCSPSTSSHAPRRLLVLQTLTMPDAPAPEPWVDLHSTGATCSAGGLAGGGVRRAQARRRRDELVGAERERLSRRWRAAPASPWSGGRETNLPLRARGAAGGRRRRTRRRVRRGLAGFAACASGARRRRGSRLRPPPPLPAVRHVTLIGTLQSGQRSRVESSTSGRSSDRSSPRRPRYPAAPAETVAPRKRAQSRKRKRASATQADARSPPPRPSPTPSPVHRLRPRPPPVHGKRPRSCCRWAPAR
jgi:hypothetical protein